MKHFLRAVGASLILAVCGAVAPREAAAQTLEDFAAIPATWNAALSPDGRLLATGCDRSGGRGVCAFDLEDGRPLGGFSPPSGYRMTDFYFASPEHLVVNVVFLEEVEFTSGFDDIVVARALSLHVPTGNVSALMRSLSGYSNTTNVIRLLPDEPETVLAEISYLRREEGGAVRRFSGQEAREFRNLLYSVDLNSGQARMVDRGSLFGRLLDQNGNAVLRVDFDQERGDYRIRQASGGNQVLYRGQHNLDRPYISGFLDQTGVLFTFPEGERRGHHRLDIVTGEITELGVGDQGSLYQPMVDEITGDVVGLRALRAGMPYPIWLDDGLEADARALAAALNVSVVDILSYSMDRRRMLISPALSSSPGLIYLYDREQGSLSIAAESHPGLSQVQLGQVETIQYLAADGLEIEGVLTYPPGADESEGPFPLVVMPHGGPYARDTEEFDWWAQAYAHLGYLVLKPNFRGSSGYGEAFRDAGFGEFGGRMIEDILDGARHLQAEGLAREGGYCLAGASYGGYAVLMGAVRAPDEVACVIAHSPVTRPLELIGDAVRGESRSGVEWWERYIGSRFMNDDSARAISPAFLADQIRAPVLVLHGVEDTTVPIDQSETLVSAFGGRDTFEFIALENDDHYLSLSQSRLTLLERSAELLQETLPVE